MADLAGLYGRLERWNIDDSTFHGNRELADELLMLDGWTVAEDPEFEGGFRWSFGPVHASETTRPHPLIDLNAAIGLVPYRHGFRLERPSLIKPTHISIGTSVAGWKPPKLTVSASIWGVLPSEGANPLAYAAQGFSSSEPAALCAAFVKLKWMGASLG